jgi:hypothetical protein
LLARLNVRRWHTGVGIFLGIANIRHLERGSSKVSTVEPARLREMVGRPD